MHTGKFYPFVCIYNTFQNGICWTQWYFQLWRSWYCAITQWNIGFCFTYQSQYITCIYVIRRNMSLTNWIDWFLVFNTTQQYFTRSWRPVFSGGRGIYVIRRNMSLTNWIDLFLVFNATFSNISAISWRPVFSGGRSRNTRRELPTVSKQLVNFITCGCESSATFFVIYKAGREPTPYWW